MYVGFLFIFISLCVFFGVKRDNKLMKNGTIVEKIYTATNYDMIISDGTTTKTFYFILRIK